MTDFPKLEALQDELDRIRGLLIELTDRVADLANQIHEALEKHPDPDEGSEPDEVPPIVPEVPEDDDGA